MVGWLYSSSVGLISPLGSSCRHPYMSLLDYVGYGQLTGPRSLWYTVYRSSCGLATRCPCAGPHRQQAIQLNARAPPACRRPALIGSPISQTWGTPSPIACCRAVGLSISVGLFYFHLPAKP